MIDHAQYYLGRLPTTDDERTVMRTQALWTLQRLRQRWEEIERSSSHAAYTCVPAWELDEYNASVHKLRLADRGCVRRDHVLPDPPLVTHTALGQPYDRLPSAPTRTRRISVR